MYDVGGQNASLEGAEQDKIEVASLQICMNENLTSF